MTAGLAHTRRELESRSNDGIDVRFLWNEHDNPVRVTMADAKTGDGFAIEVGEGERPLDVFHHPFAYAAWRDMATGPALANGGSSARRLAA
jgi:YD repeat-containing protein